MGAGAGFQLPPLPLVQHHVCGMQLRIVQEGLQIGTREVLSVAGLGQFSEVDVNARLNVFAQ